MVVDVEVDPDDDRFDQLDPAGGPSDAPVLVVDARADVLKCRRRRDDGRKMLRIHAPRLTLTRATVVGTVAAAVVAGGALVAAPAGAVPADPTYRLRIVNSTQTPDDEVFVTLTPGSKAPTLPAGMTTDTAYPLSGAGSPWVAEGGHTYSITVAGEWTSGTILYSLGATGDAFTGYTDQPTVGANEHPYDFSELTFDATSTFNGDISAVNQIGIPAQLSVLTPQGTLATRNASSLPATEYVGCVDRTKHLMQTSLTGWDPATAGVWRTRAGGGFLQIAGPGSASLYADYPDFGGYIRSLAGKTLTVRGYFAGGEVAGPGAYYRYSGEVADDGSIFLTGSLSDDADGTGTTHYPTPAGIYVAGSELAGQDDSTWVSGTGYGIYAQNGPYLVGPADSATLGGGTWTGAGTVPPSDPASYINTGSPGWTPGAPGAYDAVGNDVYGWIYGDLVVSYAMGYWGSNATGTALYDSSRWNTNRPVDPTTNPGTPWWSPDGLPAYADAWTGPAPDYPRFNVYQSATQTTGTTYGMSLGDRFSPAGQTDPEMGVTATPDGGFHGTWQVELLAGDGCARASALSQSSGGTAGGGSITVTGHNIRSGAQVSFGGVAATGETTAYDPVAQTTSVTATVPAHAVGVVDVTVTNAGGDPVSGLDSSTLSGAYRYTSTTASGPTSTYLGSGVTWYPGVAGSAHRVTARVRATAGKAPVAKVRAGARVALVVHRLPAGRTLAVAALVGHHWRSLGSVRVRSTRWVTLPTLSDSRAGARVLVRMRAGSHARKVWLATRG